MNNYWAIWVTPQGADYRRATYQRQRAHGAKPLTDNPSVEEIAAVLGAHRPKSVLEVGCGWGRLLMGLHSRFCIEGCDVSAEMLALCESQLNVFQWDICAGPPSARQWDVVFARGVFQYFDLRQIRRAMLNVSMAAALAVHVWEWPRVCQRMRRAVQSERLFYHETKKRSE